MLEEMFRLQLFAKKMLSVGLNKGFNSWLEYRDERARMTAIMNRSLNGPRTHDLSIIAQFLCILTL